MTTLALHEFHAGLQARFSHVNQAEVVTDYGDPAAEHHALRSTAGIIDLSFRGRLVALGADRRKLLNGQVTQNIRDLPDGQGCYAALVNAKARMLADLYTFALPSELLLDVEPGMAGLVRERLEKYIIADDVQLVDASALYGHLGILGPRAGRLVESLSLFPSLPGAPLSLVSVHQPGLGDLYLMNHGRVGNRGFDLFAPVACLGSLLESLLAGAEVVGARPVGWTAFETARIEAGIPRYGADMTDQHLPPECGIADRAISYTKGCYSGQEVIARIRTYGQVAKALRGLDLGGEPEAPLPAPGTSLFRDGREVGVLTSVVRSPTLQRAIALGYVRRECNGPGTQLAVGSAPTAPLATIVPLPFVGTELASG